MVARATRDSAREKVGNIIVSWGVGIRCVK
jgi:hypothetical protein